MVKAETPIISNENKREIFWNIINALLAGGLVFMGAFMDGGLSRADLIASFGASTIVFLSKLNEYWNSERKEYSNKVFNFI